MIVTIIVTAFVIVGLTLIIYWYGFRAADGRNDTARALRELLLARAEGKLTPEEFELRQAALYASVLGEPRATRATGTRWYLLLAPLSVALAMAALYVWIEKPQSASRDATGGASSSPVGAELQDLAQHLREKLAGGAMAPERPADNANRPGGDMREMAKRLADRLAREPDNGSGWALLGRSYIELQRYKDADETFAKAAKLVPRDAALLADWADAHVMAIDRKWDKQALDLVNSALSIDPKNLKALALAGDAAFSSGDYKQATAYWTRLKVAAPAGSMEAKEAELKLSDAKAKMSGKMAQAVTKPSAAASPAQPASMSVQGNVTLSPALAGKASPTDTVFIFARAAQGPRMPLAIVRRQVKDLPMSFNLDDSQAMTPEMKLSGFGEVVIGARVSKSANAVPQSGDLQGTSATVKVGTTGVSVVIDSVVP